MTCADFGEECQSAKAALRKKYALDQIIGRSKVIKELRVHIERIASCDVSILLCGESGTGKELAARAIHYLGTRSGKPFIPVSCAAIPDSLIENELWGHAKGAFTDARYQHNGLVKEAEGGTLFLDEISAITPYTQAKLLRFLQDNEYKPLGDNRIRRADVRIIAATNRNLAELIKEGKFRDDLYYRLNIVTLKIAPLRQRQTDIPLLVDHFIRRYSHEYKRPRIKFTETAYQYLLTYSWPGNVRELENKIQQIIVLSKTRLIDVKDIAFPASEPAVPVPELEYFRTAKAKTISNFERSYLIRLLTEFRGDVVRAARRAGKSRTALWNLMRKHDLSPREFRQ
jgi:two-component system response regulator GlrR